MTATSEVVRMTNSRGAEGFIAVTPETRKKFWLDRSRTAAISRHTNAFRAERGRGHPLPRMGEYCDGIERINIELSIQNKLALCVALIEFPQGRDLPLDRGDVAPDTDVLIGDRRQAALDYVGGGAPALGMAAGEPRSAVGGSRSSFLCLRRAGRRTDQQGRQSAPLPPPAGLLACFWKLELKARLSKIFDGAVYRPVLDRIAAIHKEVLRGRVFVACTCTPATATYIPNIPVNSDNYEMLQTANRAVERIMHLARSWTG